MRQFPMFLIVLALVVLSTRSANAEERELSGPFVLGEGSYSDLQSEYGRIDDMTFGRGIVGYTFKAGFQVGGGVSGYYVNLPSNCVSRGAGLVDCFLRGEDEHIFAGVNLMVGYNLELAPGIVGFEFTAIPTLPITSGTKGGAFELGSSFYLSLEKVSCGNLPVAAMVGFKYSITNFELEDKGSIEGRNIVPSAGLMAQF